MLFIVLIRNEGCCKHIDSLPLGIEGYNYMTRGKAKTITPEGAQ